MNYKCLITKSPLDNRDVDADNVYKKLTLPDVLDFRKDLNKVRDQGFQGTCAAQTAAAMKEYQEKNDIGFEGYYSPQFIYNLRFNQESEGMYPRDLMKILHKIGIIEEEKYPYNKIEGSDEISEDLKKEASNHKIKAYAQIYTIQTLKKALYKNGPCLIAFPVYNYGKRMWYQRDGDESMGGHAMAVVGYNKEGFIIRNSWGEFWEDNGHCIYPYEDWDSHWEIWTTIDDKSYLPDDEEEVKSDEEVKPDDDEEEVKPDDDEEEVKPDDEEVKPDDEEVKPDDEEVKPDDDEEVKPDDEEEVKPDDEEEVKPDEDEEVKPDDEEVKPDDEEVKPDDDEEEVNPDDDEVGPDNEEITPDNRNITPDKENPDKKSFWKCDECIIT